jgi:hypothetical protein
MSTVWPSEPVARVLLEQFQMAVVVDSSFPSFLCLPLTSFHSSLPLALILGIVAVFLTTIRNPQPSEIRLPRDLTATHFRGIAQNLFSLSNRQPLNQKAINTKAPLSITTPL